MIKSYAERIVQEAQEEAKRAAQRQQRYQELLERQKRDAEREAQRQAEAETGEHAQFMQRVQAYHERIAAGLPPEQGRPVHTIDSVFAEQRAAELAEAARLEAERIAALSPHDVIVSTLNWQQQLHIRKWEAMNKMPFPLEALGLGAGSAE